MSGGNNELAVAIAALAIAIAALFAATLQFAQAILASTKGLANCHKSVIRGWAEYTKWKPKLTQLRIEISFQAPVFFLAPAGQTRGPVPDADVWQAKGTPESSKDFRIDWDDVVPQMLEGDKKPRELVHTVGNEQSTWIWLLAAAQRMEMESEEWETEKRQQDLLRSSVGSVPNGPGPSETTLTVKIQAIRRSFDMNPAIKKPYATTTISHMVELASVLGLYWKVFEHDDNKYRAEGNGYSLTGSRIADFGIVFVFEKIGKPSFRERRIIPTAEVKELCFGRVPTLFRGPELSDVEWLDPLTTSSPDKLEILEILQLGSLDEVIETLTKIGCNVNTTLYFKDDKKHRHLFPVTFEMMGMLAKVLHIKNRCFRFLPNPTISAWKKDSFSIHRLLIAFRVRLKKDYEAIALQISEETEEEDDINQVIAGEIEKIKLLMLRSESLAPADSQREPQLTYTRMNALHESIEYSDGILKEKKHNVVLDVLRRHLQQVLAAINSPAEDEKSEKSSKTDKSKRPDKISFGDLFGLPLEKREQTFMQIYFDKILLHVVPNTPTDSETGDQAQVSRAVHEDTGAQRPQQGNGQIPQTPAQNVSPTDPTPGLTYRETWPDLEGVSKSEHKLKAIVMEKDEMERLTIWYTLVFRMICWLMLHDFDKRDVQVPKSELMGSRQPVFIM